MPLASSKRVWLGNHRQLSLRQGVLVMGSLEAVLNENGLGQWFATLDAEEISLANIMDVTSEDLK